MIDAYATCRRRRSIAVVFWGNDKREELSVADRIAKKVKGGE